MPHLSLVLPAPVVMIPAFARLLLRAGWAPIGVLILHAIVTKTSLRQPLDFTMHFCGGAAIAYFLFEAQPVFQRVLGTPTAFGRYLIAFALACTVGVFWEFGEFFSDAFLHTHIQGSLSETMSDLIADATGATVSLLMVFLVRYVTGRLRRSGSGRATRLTNKHD